MKPDVDGYEVVPHHKRTLSDNKVHFSPRTTLPTPRAFVKYSDLRNKNMNPIHKDANTEYNSKDSALPNTFDLANNIKDNEKGNLALLIKQRRLEGRLTVNALQCLI
jgi:hypothetical protein